MAVIVYDNEYEPLIVMSKPIGHHDPAIPAVFVAQKTGVVMQKFLTTGTVTVRIIQVRCKPVCTLGQPHHDLCGFCRTCVRPLQGTEGSAVVQINEAIWVSMMMSAMAGVIAVTLMIATFYCIRYAGRLHTK